MAIDRITLFRIANEDEIPLILEQYKILERNAKKDGKPYIVSIQARKAYPDPRSKGYNVIAQTTFASLEDMKFYDENCEGHLALKKVVTPRVVEPKIENMMTFYTDKA